MRLRKFIRGLWAPLLAIVVTSGIFLARDYLMPHGAPDWYGLKKETVFAIPIDLAELAVRLGSPVTFDRRGDVIWLDDFENGLNKWTLGTAFAHSEVYLSSAKAFRGTYACAIVTSDQLNGYTWITRSFQPAVVGQMGTEITYQIVDTEVDFDLGISHYTGSDEYGYRLKHDSSANKLYYLDSGSNWQEALANVYATTTPTGWNTMKLVVDFAAEEYVRAVFNDQGVPLAGHTCPHTTIGTEPGLGTVIRVHGDTSTTYQAYLDNVIITQNEP